MGLSSKLPLFIIRRLKVSEGEERGKKEAERERETEGERNILRYFRLRIIFYLPKLNL